MYTVFLGNTYGNKSECYTLSAMALYSERERETARIVCVHVYSVTGMYLTERERDCCWQYSERQTLSLEWALYSEYNQLIRHICIAIYIYVAIHICIISIHICIASETSESSYRERVWRSLYIASQYSQYSERQTLSLSLPTERVSDSLSIL